MKIFTSLALSLVLITGILVFVPTPEEASIYHDVFRLHVLASSDSAVDQADKIAVRDAILREYEDILTCSSNAQETSESLEDNLSAIRTLALDTIDYKANVRASIENAYFDARAYGDITLPAGYYDSLRIEIGEAKGQNWWCVLYPPMCTEAALGDVVIAKEETGLSEQQYAILRGDDTRFAVRFRLLEVLETTFG